MVFEPHNHTKEYLQGRPDILLELTKSSSEFAQSELCEDFDLLKTVVQKSSNRSLAHMLAKHQKIWLGSKASKNLDVLNIRDENGFAVAHTLAEFQPDWMASEEAKNVVILTMINLGGFSVAHYLAMYQKEWIKSEEAKNLEILALRNAQKISVAQLLARFNPLWLNTAEARNFQVLTLRDQDGWTVAHDLARNQSQWIHSKEANSLDILLLENKNGWTVAHCLVEHQENCVKHSALYHKAIVSREYNGRSLGQFMVEKYGFSGEPSLLNMMFNFVSQGAAYKQNKPIAGLVIDRLIEQVNIILESENDQLVKFKLMKALYSTIEHCIKGLNENYPIEQRKALNMDSYTQSIRLNAEKMIEEHVIKYPYLLEMQHTVDFNCEPADDFLKKIISKKSFKDGLKINDDLSENGDNCLINNSIY